PQPHRQGRDGPHGPCLYRPEADRRGETRTRLHRGACAGDRAWPRFCRPRLFFPLLPARDGRDTAHLSAAGTGAAFRSVVGIALLGPGVAAHVIAVAFPETRLV